MAQRLRIGLTGGIASGKSTVAKRFEELGVAVVDADDSARRVVAPGTTGLCQVIALFGPQLLNGNGEGDVLYAAPMTWHQMAAEALSGPNVRLAMGWRFLRWKAGFVA